MAGVDDNPLGHVREREIARDLPSGPDLLRSELVESLEAYIASRPVIGVQEACSLVVPFFF
jgi:hypothetical protein